MASETHPSRLALCVMLARKKPSDAILLDAILHWSRYAKATIPNVVGAWNANRREWWQRETQLSKDQVDRGLGRLCKLGLIERRQWWFGGRNVLYVRPTLLALDFIAEAKTWQAADELADAAAKKNSKFAKHGAAALPNSNEFCKNAKLSSAKLPDSNTTTNKLNNTHSNVTAQPSVCAKKDKGIETEECQAKVPSIEQLVSHWTSMVAKIHSITLEMTAKQKGVLALWLESLSEIYPPVGMVEDWRPRALDFATFVITKSGAKELQAFNSGFVEKSLDYISAYAGMGFPSYDSTGCLIVDQ